MKYQLRKFLSLITLAVFSSVQLISPLPASASTEEAIAALAKLEQKVSSVKLSNGLRVLLYRRGVAPVFAGVVITRVGGVDETPGHTGISHMLEHMAFKGTPLIGTKDYDREQELLAKVEEIIKNSDAGNKLTPEQNQQLAALNKQLEEIWIPNAFDLEFRKRGATGLNATTGKELTTYFVNFPRPAFEFWAWMESERMLKPVMRQFYKERDVIMEERRMRYDDSPEGKMYEAILMTAFQQHPYRYPVIGYETDINHLTAKATEEFQKSYYGAENIVVSIVGDVDPERDLPILEKYFGRIPRTPVPARTRLVEEPQTGDREVELRLHSSPQVAVAYHKPNYPHPDDAAFTMLEEILTGGSTSVLVKQLVEKSKKALSVSAFEGPGNAYPNLLMFHVVPRDPYGNKELVADLDKLIKEFAARGPTKEEMEIARRSVAMSYLGELRSNMSLATDLANSEILYNDWKTVIAWFKEAMLVQPEDVQRLCQQYILNSPRTIIRVEKAQDLRTTAKNTQSAKSEVH